MASSIIDRRFALEGEAKRGGMGSVWKARDLTTQRVVAVKLLHDASPEQARRFVREAALLAQLAHPGIVEYVAHGSDGSVPYLCMEWLEGESLADRLGRRSLSLLQSLAVVRGALRGLQVAHRRGLVHRDLKPSNLFLRGGDLEDVVLLDLGLARAAEDSHSLTRSGAILGTPSYMAPEQAQGDALPKPALDVFSLGCVLFECLTGAPPFVGSHTLSVLAKLLFETMPKLRDSRPELPESVEALVARMLEKDPAKRYPDAVAVAAAVEELGALEEVPPRAEGVYRPPASGAEQELVSVILAIRIATSVADAAGGAALPGAGSVGLEALVSDPTLRAETPAELGLPDVMAYGGEIKLLADGTAVIILPQRGGAATDLAARAARCVLQLAAARHDFGFVVATGRGIASARSYIGEAVERAEIMLRARAEQLESGLSRRGEPAGGGIWLDEVTAGLLDARFRVSRVEEGIVVYALEGEEPSFDPSRRLLGRPTACVGREHELGMLDLARRSCVDEGSPRAMLVIGPPGIGKSRVRYEFLRRCQAQEPAPEVLLGLGDPIRTAATRGMLAGALVRACASGAPPAGADAAAEDGTREAGDPSEGVGSAALQRAAFVRRMGRHLRVDSVRTCAFLGELCGVRFSEAELPELRSARQNPSIMTDAITAAWLAFLRAECAAAPVVLVLDDLQWADAFSVSLVGAALRELADSPLFVLALGRPETLELFPDLWAPRLATLPLHPLSAAATRRLVRQTLGDQPSDESVERIVQRAGGNALFVEELIRAADAHRDAVPQTVLAMLQARIGLLPAPLRRVLRAASVLGEYFPVPGVDALLADGSADFDLASGLASLSKDEILEPHAAERGVSRWRFRHALMRDAAYALLTDEEQIRWHGEASRYCERAGDDAAVIASHCERANDLAGAVRHYLAAAEQAYRHNDLPTVLALVERGLRCGPTGEARGALRGIEVPARFYAHDFAGSWAASAEAVAALPAGHPKRLQAVAYATFVASQLGKLNEVRVFIDELLCAHPTPAEYAAYSSALGYAAISYVVQAKRTEAAQFVSRLEELEREVGEGDPFLQGHALYWQLRSEVMLGDDPYRALQLGLRCAPCHERAGDRRMLACAQAEIGEIARRVSSLSEAEHWMRIGVALATEIGEAVPRAFVTSYLATLLAEHGSELQLAEADALARTVIELAGDGVTYRSFGQISLAVACLRRGDLPGAEFNARTARAGIERIGVQAYLPNADVALLRVLVGMGAIADAVRAAEVALSHLERNGPFGIVESAVRLQVARALRAAGREVDAREVVRVACAQLDVRAGKIPDVLARRGFAMGVPEHAALYRLAVELGVSLGGDLV